MLSNQSPIYCPPLDNINHFLSQVTANIWPTVMPAFSKSVSMLVASVELGLGKGELLTLVVAVLTVLVGLASNFPEPYAVVEPEFQLLNSFLRIVVLPRSVVA